VRSFSALAWLHCIPAPPPYDGPRRPLPTTAPYAWPPALVRPDAPAKAGRWCGPPRPRVQRGPLGVLQPAAALDAARQRSAWSRPQAAGWRFGSRRPRRAAAASSGAPSLAVASPSPSQAAVSPSSPGPSSCSGDAAALPAATARPPCAEGVHNGALHFKVPCVRFPRGHPMRKVSTRPSCATASSSHSCA